jgi:hypothetical protein
MEHSPTSATGTAWERTPWRATQRAAWEAPRHDKRLQRLQLVERRAGRGVRGLVFGAPSVFFFVGFGLDSPPAIRHRRW